MNKKYIFLFTIFFTLLITGIGWSGSVFATEAVSVTHAVKNHVSDGPVTTITLAIQVQNNSGAVMNSITVRPTPMPKDLLFMGAENPDPVSVGNIAVGASASADYSIISHMVLPQEMIAAMPIFWAVRYLDAAGQEKSAITVSGISTEGAGL